MKITQGELDELILSHEKWLRGEDEGYCLSLMGANLAGLDFSNHDLSHAQLAGSDLRKSTFRHCQLVNVSMVNCQLQGAIFTNTNLKGASFAFANCEKAVFLHVNLEGILLRDTIAFYHTVTKPEESVPGIPRLIAGPLPKPKKRKKKPESLLTKVIKYAKLWI